MYVYMGNEYLPIYDYELFNLTLVCLVLYFSNVDVTILFFIRHEKLNHDIIKLTLKTAQNKC